MTEKFELVFEKDYELLQEINYSCKGEFKKTKTVILKAPTMRNAEKFEVALKGGPSALLKFICGNELMIAPDKSPITATDIDNLHAVAVFRLAEDYTKFFFDLSPLTSENPNKI
jgi:hypothetical protein